MSTYEDTEVAKKYTMVLKEEVRIDPEKKTLLIQDTNDGKRIYIFQKTQKGLVYAYADEIKQIIMPPEEIEDYNFEKVGLKNGSQTGLGGSAKENTESPNEESTERSVAQEEIPKNRITIFDRNKIVIWAIH